ncbi:hypothetical protein BU16DRAFT_60636 [Lophium mytilinum]|uniref:Uncharacterized protein n=1 Tax=Lophium mytilinum TaxID=390894 RepID=A0A6A6QPA7_9PEZI|nr:hypothetical protein BU16DRAFT_60636 [Lophium mytilinum]
MCATRSVGRTAAARITRMTEDEMVETDRGVPWAARDAAGFCDNGGEEVDWVQVGEDEFVRTVTPKRASMAGVGGRKRERSISSEVDYEVVSAYKKPKTHHDAQASEEIILIETNPVYEMRSIFAWEWQRWSGIWDDILSRVPTAAENEEDYEERVCLQQLFPDPWDPETDRTYVDPWIYQCLQEAAWDSPLTPVSPTENHTRKFENRGVDLVHPLSWVEVKGGTKVTQHSKLLLRRVAKHHVGGTKETLRQYLSQAKYPINSGEVTVLEAEYGPCQCWGEKYGIKQDVLYLHVPWWSEDLAPEETESEGDDTDDEEPVQAVESDSLAKLLEEFVETFHDTCEQGLNYIDQNIEAVDNADSLRDQFFEDVKGTLVDMITFINKDLEAIEVRESSEFEMPEDDLDPEKDAMYCADVLLGEMLPSSAASEMSDD